MNVHCFFEQSGTFRDEFIKLGFNAWDYDIDNQFGKTDCHTDLFRAIECYDFHNEFCGGLFDDIYSEDLVFAFFPCTLFQCFNPLLFTCQHGGFESLSDLEKIQFVMNRHKDLHRYYMVLCKLVEAALKLGFKLIIENPYTQPHYLTSYFPFKPSLIDMDRRCKGDFFKKPTQYWFFNCKPLQNIVLEPVTYKDSKVIMNVPSGSIERSLISPDYARYFILENIIDFDFPGSIIRSEF